MDKQAVFAALEARAFAARTTLHQVCKETKTSPTTITRWRKDAETMRATTLKKLEDRLAEIEAERSQAA
jgi:hypothetical protein